MMPTTMNPLPQNPNAPVPPHPRGDGLLLVISGPSGVGKTTIAHQLVDRLNALFSVSMTTRPKASADVEGEDYYFVTPERFEKAIAGGELLEWANVFGNYYGTPRKPVEEQVARGRDVVLEIDVNGAMQIKHAFPDALTIFVLPPSEQELLNRLRSRGREDEAVIQKRFGEAQREIRMARESGAYDQFLVNERLEDVIEQAHQVVMQRKQPSSR